ncbi:MAG: hypothetical protein QG568_671 [Patescibacteria group bacterium]|nr:hypothetical protein [Patescibacteria group bacterium]
MARPEEDEDEEEMFVRDDHQAPIKDTGTDWYALLLIALIFLAFVVFRR